MCLLTRFDTLRLHRNAKRTIQNSYAADVELTQAELGEIWGIIDGYEVQGDRYFGGDPKTMHLWG